MPAKAKTNTRLTRELLETAADMRASGLLTKEAHRKITMRHLEGNNVAAAAPVLPDDIRKMRLRANVSQAVFASYLNLTVGYVSQLERGAKQASGAALAMLNVIRRKGIDAIR